MVILIKTYECSFGWLGGSGYFRFLGIVGVYEQWVVISNWELTKVEDYVNG